MCQVKGNASHPEKQIVQTRGKSVWDAQLLTNLCKYGDVNKSPFFSALLSNNSPEVLLSRYMFFLGPGEL